MSVECSICCVYGFPEVMSKSLTILDYIGSIIAKTSFEIET